MAYGLYRVDQVHEGVTIKCVQVVAFSMNAALDSFIRTEKLGELDETSVLRKADTAEASTTCGATLRVTLVRRYEE